MAANPSIANPSIIPDKEQSADREQSAFEGGQLNSAGLLERAEEELRKAFGDDEKTIANSLRGL